MIENTLLINISVLLASIQLIAIIFAIITIPNKDIQKPTLFLGLLVTVNSFVTIFSYLASEILSLNINPWLQAATTYILGLVFLYFCIAILNPKWFFEAHWFRWMILVMTIVAPLGVMLDVTGFSMSTLGQPILYQVPELYQSITGVIPSMAEVTPGFIGNLYLYSQFFIVGAGMIFAIFYGIFRGAKSGIQKLYGVHMVIIALLTTALLYLNINKLIDSNSLYLLLHSLLGFLLVVLVTLTGSYTVENKTPLVFYDKFLNMSMFSKLTLSVSLFFLPPLMFTGASLSLANYNTSLENTITTLDTINKLEVNNILQTLDQEINKLSGLSTDTNITQMGLPERERLINSMRDYEYQVLLDDYEEIWQGAQTASETAISTASKAEAWKEIIDQESVIKSSFGGSHARVLQDYLALNEQYFNISIYDYAGGLVTSATSNRYLATDFVEGNLVLQTPEGVPEHYNGVDEDWYRDTYNDGEGDIYISDPAYDARADAYMTTIAVPIYSPENPNQVIGIINAQYDMSNLLNTIASFVPSENGKILLYDSQTNYVRPNYNDLLDIPQLNFQAFARARENWSITRVFDTKSVVMISSLLSNDYDFSAPWVLATHIPVDEAFEGVVFIVRSTAVLIVSIALVSMLILVIMGNVITRPLIRLTLAAEQTSQGNYDIRVDIPGDDEIGVLAKTFNQLAKEVSTLVRGLEETVNERTEALEKRASQLETTAQVAREATSISNLDTLLGVLVRLISERFEYYHAGIFLLDDQKAYAELRASNSEGGQRMLRRRHKLQVGKVGVVGYAAGTGEPRIAQDVGADVVYYQNPDMPDTKSELALPLKVFDEVIGVLDVQSTRENAFSREEQEVLQTLADQIAPAIQNSLLLQRSQSALQELQFLYGEGSSRAWMRKLQGEQYNYEFNQRSSGSTGSNDDEKVIRKEIIFRDQSLGTIELVRDDDSNWLDEEMTLVDYVVQQTAMALENARLVEETRLRTDQTQLLQEITAVAASELDQDELLRTVSKKLLRGFNLSHSQVKLFTEKKEFSRVVVDYDQELSDNSPFIGKMDTLENNEVTLEMIRSREIMVVYDVLNNPQTDALREELISHEAATLVLVPLIVREEVIGMLSLELDNPNRQFEQSDLTLLTQIAAQVSQALEVSTLFRAEQRSKEATTALLEISQMASSSFDLSQVLYQVAHRAAQVADAYNATISRIRTSPTGPSLEPIAAVLANGSTDNEYWKATSRIEHEVVTENLSEIEKVFRESDYIQVIDRNSPDYLKRIWLTPYNYYSRVVVMLRSQDGVAGFFTISNKEDRKFSPEQVELTQTIGGLITTTILNANLFEETVQRAEREHMVSDISAKIRASNDPQVILETAVQELRKALGAKQAHVILPDESGLKKP